MIVYIVMKENNKTHAQFVHAVWVTEQQAKEVCRRCNAADKMNSYYVDDTHELNNDLGQSSTVQT
jgi:hypothetical protein